MLIGTYYAFSRQTVLRAEGWLGECRATDKGVEQLAGLEGLHIPRMMLLGLVGASPSQAPRVGVEDLDGGGSVSR